MKMRVLTDKEMLELAADAAGISRAALPWNAHFSHPADDWNPLHNDGQAFRLMANLCLHSQIDRWCGWIYVNEGVSSQPNKAALYRRAIVRAAAARQEVRNAKRG